MSRFPGTHRIEAGVPLVVAIYVNADLSSPFVGCHNMSSTSDLANPRNSLQSIDDTLENGSCHMGWCIYTTRTYDDIFLYLYIIFSAGLAQSWACKPNKNIHCKCNQAIANNMIDYVWDSCVQLSKKCQYKNTMAWLLSIN